MTLAKLRELVGEFLVKEWQVRADLSDERLQSFLDHGIPEDWAQAIASAIPTLPVSVWPKLLHPPKLLQKRTRPSIVNSNKMNADHRLAISKGRAEKDPFAKAARKRGYSQNSLAKAVGIPASLLSMYRREDRKIPHDRAVRIYELIGWPPDAKHWPGGIVSDD